MWLGGRFRFEKILLDKSQPDPEVSEGEEEVVGGFCWAFEGAGAGFAGGGEAVAGGLEGVVDEGFAADDGTVGEVTDAVQEDGGEGVLGEEGVVFAGFQHFGGVLLGFGGFAFLFSGFC